MIAVLERFFHLRTHKTTVKDEIIAGLTTFSTMAYIIFVNPQILHQAGVDFGAAMLATILASCLATLCMGLGANYPFALAPGMGLNAYFTYSIVLTSGHSWQIALATCFISGVTLFLLTVVGIRQVIMHAIPSCLRHSVAGGIGLFLAFIGFKNVGIVVAHPITFVTIGNIAHPAVVMTAIGLILLVTLMYYQVKGAMLISILFLWLVGLATGLSDWKGMIAAPVSLAPTWMQLDLVGALHPDLLGVVLSFVFVAIFDTTGTLIALAEQGKFLDAKGKLPRANRALINDSIGTMAGSLIGTSPTTTYLESASGIAAGGRTGLTAVVVAFLFFLSIFFSPLAQSIPLFATAPVLIAIGTLMLRGMTNLDWDDPSECIPACIILISIPLTFSIGTGISLGFMLYPVIKLLCGKARDVHPIVWLLAALFFFKTLFLEAV